MKKLNLLLSLNILNLIKYSFNNYSIFNILLDTLRSVLFDKSDLMPELAGLSERYRRIRKCSYCEDKITLFKNTPQCSLCGCFLNAKVKYLKSKCPKGYW